MNPTEQNKNNNNHNNDSHETSNNNNNNNSKPTTPEYHLQLLAKPFAEWSREEVAQWFQNSPRYNQIAEKFSKYSSSVFASEPLLAAICGDPVLGSSLYRDLQNLNKGIL